MSAGFGGLGFGVHGNLAVSASGQGGLLLRVLPEDADTLLAAEGVDRLEMRGRPMNGWLHVGPPATATEEDLGRWVDTGLTYAASLPPK